DTISSINLIRAGSNTHDFDSEQRLIPVSFSQSGTQITATVNASPEIAPPGYYMLFAFNTSGVPAVAPIIFVPQAAQSLPDLIPTSLSYNSTTGLFTIVVKNQGTGATPTGVTIGNGFYVDGNFVTWGAVPGPLAPGASVTIDSSGGGAYTIASGTHTIKTKVNDFSTTGRFVESDPSNNTLSQTITIGGSAPTASLSASPTTITSGHSSTLTWSSTNATSCSGTGFTASGTSGSTSVSPTATTTYTVTCNGAAASATASTTVTVTTSAPTASLSASPTTIVSGQSSTLTWSSTNATSCSGTGFTASGTSGSTSVSPTATTTYTVTCNGAAASATVTVTATALPDLIATSFIYNSTTHLFTIVVKNQGAGPTPNGVVIGNGFYVDGNFVTWGAVPGPLAPGAPVTIDSSGGGAYTIASGTHTIMVKVDDFGCCGRITESDKTNNTRTQSITLP
ncbi:MAG TPA: galactose oxidase-like domain-containing protein, partial [Methylophilaceae bacterium]